MAGDEDREIKEAHRQVLQQSLGLKEHEELPPKLKEKYWELKRVFDRANTIVPDHALCFLVFLHGGGKPTEKEKAPPTVVDLWRAGQIKAEALISVKYRNSWVDATLKMVNSNDEVIAQVVGDPDERKFAVKDVRPAAMAA